MSPGTLNHDDITTTVYVMKFLIIFYIYVHRLTYVWEKLFDRKKNGAGIHSVMLHLACNTPS